MIQTAGVDRNLVPATDSIYTRILTSRLLAVSWRSLEPWTQRIPMTARETLPPNHRGDAEDKNKHCCSHYPAVTLCGHVESPSILQRTFAILPV
jgi:hypothetical protein